MQFGFRANNGSSIVLRTPQRGTGAGGAIARGLVQVGQTAARVSYRNAQVDEQVAASETRIALREEQRARDVQIADAAVRKANLEIELAAELETLRKSAPVGATGHAEAARAKVKQVYDGFIASLPADPQVRNRFLPTIASATARAVIGEQGWESKTRARFLGESYSQWLDTSASGLYSDPGGERWQEMITEGDAIIEGLDLDETTKAIMQRDLRARATSSQFSGLIESGRQDLVRQAIDSGKFDSVLSDTDKTNWNRLISAANRSADVQGKALANEAKQAALDSLEAFEVRIERGDDVPSPAEIRAAIASAKGAGVTEADLLDFAYMAEDALVSAGLSQQTTRQLETRKAALQRRMDGGKATNAEMREADLIDSQLDNRTETSANALGKGWRSDVPDDKIAALDMAADLPAPERMRAAARVGNGFQLLTALPKAQRDIAVRGAAIRKARPDDFLPPATAATSNRSLIVERHLRNQLGDLIHDSGQHFDDIVDTALDIMAGSRTANGRDAGWHLGDFQKAVQVIYGQRRFKGQATGGIGQVGRFKVELPERYSAEMFERFLNASEFEGAEYADGTPAQAQDVRRHYRPRYAGDDGHHSLYTMQGPDGALAQKGGGYFVLRVPKRMTFGAPQATPGVNDSFDLPEGMGQ